MTRATAACEVQFTRQAWLPVLKFSRGTQRSMGVADTLPLPRGPSFTVFAYLFLFGALPTPAVSFNTFNLHTGFAAVGGTASDSSTLGRPARDRLTLSLDPQTGAANRHVTRRKRGRQPTLFKLGSAATSSTKSPPPEILSSEDEKVRRNLERLRQVSAGEMSTVRAITSSALRGKLKLSGKDKRGRIFLPGDRGEASLDELKRLLKETFPIGDFPVALYVKTSLEDGAEKTMLITDGNLRYALEWAEQEKLDLNLFIDVHPDYKEEAPPDWLVDVPDPDTAEEWEMLSFYRFVEVAQPEAFANMLQRSWDPLGVRGRIYVASEGVNAQMAIPSTSTDRFERAVEAVEKLAGVYLNKAERRWSAEEFKADPPFPALHVRARKQIVADGLMKPLEWSETSGRVGKGLSPEEWHDMLGKEGTTVLDCRNSYESAVGTFDTAVPLDTSFFRESWDELERLVGNADRNAPVMTYCTGGIRCVKVAAYLEQEMGFTNVTRLEGGIVSYSKFAKEKGLESKFKGMNYVFDKRMGDRVTSDMLSKCHQCEKPCADHTNCANPCCHARLIQCSSCANEYNGCCSNGCVDQHGKQELRQSVMLAEREAMGWGGSISTSVGSMGVLQTEMGVPAAWDGGDGGEFERDRRNLLWLLWPFQDPTLNLLFDRAFEEFRETVPSQAEELGTDKPDASRMMGIVTRLGGGKRALAVGLGAGGSAGRAALRRVAEALGEGGELTAVEASPEAAAAARGLSLVSGARGCRITVTECEEASMLDRLLAESGSSISAIGGDAETAPITPPPQGMFDVILLGSAGDISSSSNSKAEDSGQGWRNGSETPLSPAERLGLVLDKRLIKRKGLVLCDPATLSGGEAEAQLLAARALEIRGTVEHARVPGAGPQGGLHIFKWKTYSH